MDELKRELKKIIDAMDECCTTSGCIKDECRYRYQMLFRKKDALEVSIDWIESQQLVGGAI